MEPVPDPASPPPRGEADEEPSQGPASQRSAINADSIADVSRARWTTRALGTIVISAALVATPLLTGAAVAVPARAHAAKQATDSETTPLSVTLTSMAPAEIPRKGVITLTGVVANSSAEDWTDINVAPFVSSAPITTRDELAEAAATAASVAVGERLTDSGTYAAVGDLAPGAQAPFTIRVPVTSLPNSTDPGVYWIGVHALGANVDGRDLVADGRARTFIPLVPRAVARTRSVPVSVVLPMRERARRAADGSLNGPARWVSLTRPEGRLSRVVDFGASAGAAPVSWLVDPAVLDALDDFSRGNPGLSFGSKRAKGAEKQDDGQPSSSASPSTTPSTKSGSPSEEERSRAATVLETFLGTARSHDLLTLGYADPDVVSLARRRPSLLKRADTLAAKRMAVRSLTGAPVVAPPSGYFDPDLLPEVPKDTLMVLSDRGKLETQALSLLPSGQDLVLSDARASAGGPAPTTPLDPLALRQRVLSDAALEATKGSEPPRPIVVNVPYGWDPGAYWRQADFFGGLQRPWVRLAPVPRGATSAYDGTMAYGPAQLKQEIRGDNVDATRTLVRTSDVLGHLLANENDVTERLTGAALQASAYSARPTLGLAAEQVQALDATVRTQLDKVQVTGTDFVTLSGGSGTLTVTLVNGLDQPITIGLRARTDSPAVKVRTPEPVSMQAGQRTTLRLRVASGIGVHEVKLYPVTAQGEEAGTPLTFSLRTSQVGRLIWYIIIAGGTLLAVMIVRRIVLRIRNHRWRPDGTE
ncbi:MAG: hypothetical protein JWN22_2214 [Nocardioides sp.]|nr:hypothetical protein [Nocardioides sp.]